MEMVEEGQNQPKNATKRNNTFQKIVKKVEEDRISALPDCLLVEILSRLPSTEDAIRTSTLSSRWKHIWTSVPVLIFRYKDCRGAVLDPEFGLWVNKTLTQCRQLKLKKFVLSTGFGPRNLSQINSCICYAIRCNVEKLDLSLWSDLHGDEFQIEFQLDQKIFTNSSFTDLKVEGCTWKPTGRISWTNLRSLWITEVDLDEDLIENILSGSPLLETLVLESCKGVSQLDITSKSVNKLVLSGYGESYYDDILKINAPYILSLTIKGHLELWDLLLLNVSSLIEADLHYYHNLRNLWDEERTQTEEMLERLILKLSHVKDLKIGRICAKDLSHLKAKGFVVPSNIKIPALTYKWSQSESESDSGESGDW